jgi:hypothetical protein
MCLIDITDQLLCALSLDRSLTMVRGRSRDGNEVGMTPAFLRSEAAFYRGLAQIMEPGPSKLRLLTIATDYEALAVVARRNQDDAIGVRPNSLGSATKALRNRLDGRASLTAEAHHSRH